MRIVAAIYLTIMLVNFAAWLASGSSGDPFPTIASYVMWSLYFLSVLALLAFVFGVRLLPRRTWQAVFVVYLAYRAVELITAGLAVNGHIPAITLNAVASYLWLVVPPGLAMWYLGFVMASTANPTHAHAPGLAPVSQARMR